VTNLVKKKQAETAAWDNTHDTVCLRTKVRGGLSKGRKKSKTTGSSGPPTNAAVVSNSVGGAKKKE